MIMKRIMNDKQDLLKLDEIIFSGFNGAKAQEMEWKLPVLKLHERTRNSPELKKATIEILEGYAKYKLAEARLKDLENGKDSDQEKIAAIRKEVEDWEKDFKTKKLMLPMISVHAYFEKGRKDSDPHTFNNLILTDIDHISEEQINELMPKIKKSPHVVFACRSVRGEGIHILNYVEVEGGINDENFKNVFNATTRLIEYDLNIEADKAVGSISRTMFLNYDEQAYYNPEATPLDINTAVLLEKIDINDLKFQEMTEKEKLTAYLDAAKPNLNWSNGNRHSTIVSLASTLKKAGFDLDDVVSECTSRYVQSGFDVEEIERTIRDVYHRYSSEHGTNRKSQQTKKDKGTKGHIDTSKVTEEEPLDEEDFLNTHFPSILPTYDYIPRSLLDYCIDPESSEEIKFTALISLITILGFVEKDIRCMPKRKEIINTLLYINVVGDASSGKSCIDAAYKLAKAYSKNIELRSAAEAKEQDKKIRLWENCIKKSSDTDCNCGEEPTKIEPIRLALTHNISKSKLIKQLEANAAYSTLIYTSELDAAMLQKDNPISSIFRSAFKGEEVSSHTHQNGDHKVEAPKVATLSAGTPSQQARFFNNKEDGLVARYLDIFLPETPYIGLPEDEDLDLYNFEAFEKTVFEQIESFGNYFSDKKFVFKLTPAANKMINEYFGAAPSRFAQFASKALNGFIRRLRDINIRIAMILEGCKLYKDNAPEGIYNISSETMKLVISWNDFFIEEKIRMFNILPELPQSESSNEIKYAAAYKKLPCDFTFGDAKRFFEDELGVSAKTAQRTLKFWKNKDLVKKRGEHYTKKECLECTENA